MLHSLFTTALLALVSVLLYRDHQHSLLKPGPRSAGIDLSGQLSDVHLPAPPPHMSANLGYHVDATTTKPRVLLVNDDGPPGKNSPHVLGLYKELVSIGWDVTVVLPSSRKLKQCLCVSHSQTSTNISHYIASSNPRKVMGLDAVLSFWPRQLLVVSTLPNFDRSFVSLSLSLTLSTRAATTR